MRIISGNLRGARLYMAKEKTTRPLKDLARESIFNLLTHSNKISFELEGCIVLDLYAGIGSFGLECLSRKARQVFFIENDKSALKILEKNIEKLKIKKKTKIFFDDVFKLIGEKNILKLKFDLIFCDPPFRDKNTSRLIELIFKEKLLNKDGIIILHRNINANEKFPYYFKVTDERTYGVSKIIFGKFLS